MRVLVQVPWSHHSVIGDRTKVTPIEMKVTNTGHVPHVESSSERAATMSMSVKSRAGACCSAGVPA